MNKNKETFLKSIVITVSSVIITINAYLILSNKSIYTQFQASTETGLYPWLVLLMCILFSILKLNTEGSNKLNKDVDFETSYFTLGLALIILSIIIPQNIDLPYNVFKILLGYLGIYFLIVEKAALLPMYLLTIFGFSIAFPEIANLLISDTFLNFIAWTTAKISSLFIPVSLLNNTIRITSLTNENIVILINTACTGVAALALFVAIFALMMMDTPLQKQDAAVFFVIGLTGTFVQNIARLVALLFIGYQFGSQTLSVAHAMIGYFIFGMYYLLFAYLYLRKARTYQLSSQS
jgi:exosortase/archaeosortase family protein